MLSGRVVCHERRKVETKGDSLKFLHTLLNSKRENAHKAFSIKNVHFDKTATKRNAKQCKNLLPVFITKELFIQVSAVAHTQMMHKTFNTAVLRFY